MEDEQQLARVKDWINSHHLGTLRLTDVLSSFPDISLVRTFAILEVYLQLQKRFTNQSPNFSGYIYAWITFLYTTDNAGPD